MLGGRDAPRLEHAAAAARQRGATVDVVCGDLLDDAYAARLVERAGPRIDVLVHCAGVYEPGPLSPPAVDALDRQWRVNVRAPFALTALALQAGALGAGSAVVLVSSISGLVGMPAASGYCATKGAVELLIRAWAVELGPLGVRVCGIAPGVVRTPINAFEFADPDHEPDVVGRIPAGRVATAGEIAGALAFLASDAAVYVNGSTLVIDGGWTAR